MAASASSELKGPKTPDPKTLRRLAQNREAARKSRLRKKVITYYSYYYYYIPH
jgi:transcription factor TGA